MSHLTMQEQISLFFNSWRSIDKLYDEYAKSIGLTYLGLNVLNVIYETGTCMQKTICEKTRLPKQSVNVIIRSLWKQGYIEMKELDTDRRNKEIRLSESGKKYAEQTIGKLLMAEKSAMEQLTHEQRQSMVDLIKQVEINLREIIQVK